jgi:hypothetical protein
MNAASASVGRRASATDMGIHLVQVQSRAGPRTAGDRFTALL